MKLPFTKKILKEDLKGAPSWANNIIEPVNSFMESVYQLLNRNVTFTENFFSFVKEINYITPSTYPSGVGDIQFVNLLKSKASGIIVAQAYEKSTYIAAPGPVYAPWVEVNSNIVISTITGLEASKTYLIRLVVF